jgi:calcineurin-like phosphoesterase family protein
MIFLTSDSHFSHTNIIKYCNRPFTNADLMNNRMFENWNSVVSPEDEVYHLGDVGCWFKDNSWIEEYVSKLNGKLRLIPGNHDKKLLQQLKRYFQILDPIHNIRYKSEEAGDIGIVLSHYPIWSWEGMFHGSLHGYGHTHNDINELAKGAIHVGVDTNNFTPLSIDEFIVKATKRIIGNE